MIRILASIVVLHGLLFGAVATAQALAERPPQARLIERFVAALSAGDVPGALSTLTSDVVLEEHGLTRRLASGTRAVQDRLWALVLDGAVTEIEQLHVLEGGRIVITVERVWSDDTPEGLAPLRLTGIYVIEGELLASIGWWLDPADRDALMAPALVGTWRGGDRGLVVRFDADGTFRSGFSEAQVAEAPRDGGRFELERSLLTWSSDDTTVMCTPADEGTHHLRFLDADTIEWQMIGEACLERYMGTRARLVRLAERE